MNTIYKQFCFTESDKTKDKRQKKDYKSTFVRIKMVNQQPAARSKQPATSNQQPATSNQQPATSNPKSVTFKTKI
jgi:hypothetical protein